MHVRRRAVRAVQAPQIGQLHIADPCRRLYFLSARMRDRDIPRRALLQKKLGCLDLWFRMESFAHFPLHQRIRDCHHGHALVVSHEGSNDGDIDSFRQTARCVIQCLVKSVATACADCREPRKIAYRGLWTDHRGKRGGIRGDNGILAQTAFEPEARHAEVRILIRKLKIARVISRFRDAPRYAEACSVVHLPADNQPIRLLKEAADRSAHNDRRHQIFKHRSRPGNERRAVPHRCHGSSEAKPVTRWHVAFGDGDETR